MYITNAYILRGHGKQLFCPKKVDLLTLSRTVYRYVSIIPVQMNVQCRSYAHREASATRYQVHAQLQMDRFRFVNQDVEKFVTKRVIRRTV